MMFLNEFRPLFFAFVLWGIGGLLFFKIYVMHSNVLSACMCITYVPGTHGGQKRASDSLELKP